MEVNDNDDGWWWWRWWWRWRRQQQWNRNLNYVRLLLVFYRCDCCYANACLLTQTAHTHIVLRIFPLKFFVFIAFSNENEPHVIPNVLVFTRKAAARWFYINTRLLLHHSIRLSNEWRTKQKTLLSHSLTYVQNNSLENVIMSTSFLIEHNALGICIMCVWVELSWVV